MVDVLRFSSRLIFWVSTTSVQVFHHTSHLERQSTVNKSSQQASCDKSQRNKSTEEFKFPLLVTHVHTHTQSIDKL